MKDACACGSALRYARCCRPHHQGTEPATAVELMRSRFCAYARGEVAYLFRTLHPDHPDRAAGEAALCASVRTARQRLKYVRLRVLDHADGPGADEARVLFHAEIYEKGSDRSFAELSLFRKVGTSWRYLGGDARAIPAGEATLAGLKLPAPWKD